ncbi:hypothetical protein ADL35_19725, partial [Streptomyces sp. NRRL WC-3753]
AAAAALLGGAAVWALYGSSWLRVESVTAEGTRVLTPAQVEKAAAVPKISKVTVNGGITLEKGGALWSKA